jgi:hypothetical protein
MERTTLSNLSSSGYCVRFRSEKSSRAGEGSDVNKMATTYTAVYLGIIIDR